MGMTLFLGQIIRRTCAHLHRHFRIVRLAIVLGASLWLGLFLQAAPAFSANISPAPSVTLAWDASPDTHVVGYNLYYGVASGTYTTEINVGTVTSATVTGLTAGVTYYFAVTAYDSFGQESDYSSEISYLVPAPGPNLQISRAPTGQFTLTVTGLTGQTYQILASPDLTTWTVIGTVIVGAGGSGSFTDTNAANFPQSFYRTQATP